MKTGQQSSFIARFRSDSSSAHSVPREQGERGKRKGRETGEGVGEEQKIETKAISVRQRSYRKVLRSR